MRITTSQMFDRSMTRMSALSSHADAVQTQISTNKRFTRPSDDASAYQRLDGLRRANASDAAYGANVELAQGLLSQTDSTLTAVQTQLQRALEMATQAGNGVMTDSNRAQLAGSIDAVIDDLLGLANTRDVRGQPLFGGTAGDTAYARAAGGSIAYVASGEPSAIPIGDGNSVQATVDGRTAFGSGESDMFAVLSALSAALHAGGDVSEAAGEAMEGINASLDQISTARASVGARAIRLDLEAARLETSATTREESRQAIEDTDIASAITELQKTLTVLQATQSSFTKLSGMSLFDFIR